jgi:alkanesulfonate monooxygenase SsuD/methylene tetrahydromethanopterin reductase-like flavin-dependent oxidoreductase (luciferase family)
VRTDVLLDPFGTKWDEALQTARAAEEAGFEGVWIWDHLAGGVHGADRVLECWTVLAAVAASTTRVALGPLVLNVANRHPGLVAVMAATLQEVSGGRLLLGIGAGGGAETPYAAEQAALGRPVPSDPVRRRQVEEAVGIIRRLWTGGGAGFLRPDPVPPIMVGGFGPKMAELAGRVGDGLNTPAGPRLEALAEVARRAHTAAGGDPARFLITASAGMGPRWVDPGSADRARLEAAGVERLILLVRPGNQDALTRAGRMLSG